MLPSFWAYAHLYVLNFSLYTNIRTHDFSETIMVLGEGAQAPQMPPWAPRTIKCFWNWWEYISDFLGKLLSFIFFLSRKKVFYLFFSKKNCKILKILKKFFWPQMTSSDLRWPLMRSMKNTIQNKPKIANECRVKLVITILGLKRNYYVMRSPDVKTKVASVFLGSELP